MSPFTSSAVEPAADGDARPPPEADAENLRTRKPTRLITLAPGTWYPQHFLLGSRDGHHVQMDLHDYARSNILFSTLATAERHARPTWQHKVLWPKERAPTLNSASGGSKGALPGTFFVLRVLPGTGLSVHVMAGDQKEMEIPALTRCLFCIINFINPAARPATAVRMCMVGAWVRGSVVGGSVWVLWYTGAGHVFWSAGAALYHAAEHLRRFS